MKRCIATLFVLPMVVLLTSADDGCGDNRTASDKRMDSRQAILTEQADAQVGMPGITNFTEKKIVRKLYELRDQNIATFAYIPDMQGKLWHLCDSIGYGLPYGVQFSNPHRPLNPAFSQSSMADQAEPNGLFMPPTAEGTWIICVNGQQKGDFEPVYVEPRVIVSPFKLRAEGEYAAK
jgi:hypothetical protein